MGADRAADAEARTQGRPREVEFREVINAVRYLLRSGCGWRMPPAPFGHWRTVYGWFRELSRRFLFQTIHDVELMLDRERQGREASPSAAVVDSQSIKAPHAGTPGYDAGKQIAGRERWPWVKHLFADAASDRLKLMEEPAYLDFVLDIIRRRDNQKGFEVLPRRRVVERTFGWMIPWRRLVRDYERRIDVSSAMFLVAMGGRLIRRNAHP